MSVIELPKNELITKYNKVNHCLYRSSDSTVIKDCSASVNAPEFLNERLILASEMPKLEGYTFPINFYKDNDNLYAYEMDYLENYITITEYVKKLKSGFAQLSFETKKIILLKILKCLKELNKTFIVGDINLNNIMFDSKGNGKIIDWENGYPIDNPLPVLQMYDFKNAKSAIQSDSIKLFVCAISLLYEVDFGEIFQHLNFQRFLDFVETVGLDTSISKFLDDFTYELNVGSLRCPYFDEYLDSIKDITGKELSKVHEKYKIQYYKETLYSMRDYW